MYLSSISQVDGAAIQQAVWRPTGTQLGKKKTLKESNKPEKNATTPKKKNPPKKLKARNAFVDDGAPVDSLKPNQSNEQQQGFIFQQTLPPPPPAATQATEMQPPAQSLSTNQTEFSNALGLVQQPQPIYQHPGLNIVQNWPLDLVQTHYSQVYFYEILQRFKKCAHFPSLYAIHLIKDRKINIFY